MLTTEQLSTFKDALENERLTLRERILASLTDYPLTQPELLQTHHLIGLCQDEGRNSKHLGFRLERVDAALCAMMMEMYGLCADCEDEITVADLEKDPAEPRCKSCRMHDHYHHEEI
ncbi:DksA protein [Parasalinivibrio latis]|uniref:TraR/DksA family transcriptional regulator n=1 Tax=Parasalinivibrio latis TaxID=2952610 RepID=UPI0030E2100A